MHCNTVRRTSSDSPASIEKILNLFNRVLVRSTVLDFGGSQALYSVTILQKQNLHSISLFTGTCLGGFAAVALAKIRKKKAVE